MGRGEEPPELNIGMVYRPAIRSLEIILNFKNFAYELTLSLLDEGVCGFRVTGGQFSSRDGFLPDGRYSNSGIISVHDLKQALLSKKQFEIEVVFEGVTIPDLDRNAKRILEWLG